MTPTTSATDRIRELNDEFRRMGPLFSRHKFDGLWLITGGVQATGPSFTWRAIWSVQTFDSFTADNDPHGEHDFGAFEVGGERLFWKIDYLQRGTQFGAEDPSDNVSTCRIVTIMLAEDS
jgi:Protein of unknown function (DUF3768)